MFVEVEIEWVTRLSTAEERYRWIVEGAMYGESGRNIKLRQDIYMVIKARSGEMQLISRRWLRSLSTERERRRWLREGRMRYVDRKRAVVDEGLYEFLKRRLEEGWSALGDRRSVADWCLEMGIEEPLFSTVVDMALRLAKAGEIGVKRRGFYWFTREEIEALIEKVEGYVVDGA